MAFSQNHGSLKKPGRATNHSALMRSFQAGSFVVPLAYADNPGKGGLGTRLDKSCAKIRTSRFPSPNDTSFPSSRDDPMSSGLAESPLMDEGTGPISAMSDPCSNSEPHQATSNESTKPLPYKPRIRRNFPRSKLGCLTCRSRRKKCDEKLPTCQNCERRKVECCWPAGRSTTPPKPSEDQKTGDDVYDMVSRKLHTGFLIQCLRLGFN